MVSNIELKVKSLNCPANTGIEINNKQYDIISNCDDYLILGDGKYCYKAVLEVCHE